MAAWSLSLSFYKGMILMSKTKRLQTIDGESLMSLPLTPLNFVVDTLLSQGLHILAGSPKVGKSWLALWLSVMVAKGEPVWGMSVKQGTTLYLCLEDSVLRIQNRLFEITEDAPSSVHFCTECALIGQGLEEQVETFLTAHPDTVLVIIDTLQMVRPIHDATQELWDTVHQMMKARRRENGKGEVQPFAGLVKCADCGSSLNVSYDKKHGRYTGFSCWVYKNYGKERCTSHAIGWKTLNQLVLEDIRRNAIIARTNTGEYMDMLIAAKTEKKKAETDRCRRELKKVDKRIAELSKILTKLYEDAALEKISEERYQAMAPGYEREQVVLKEKREELMAEIAHSEEIYENIEAFLPVIWKYTNITELTPHILNELIEKIVVHEKVVAEDGSKSQQVDIHYKFIGCVNWKREPASYETIEAAVLQEHQTLSEQSA